MLARSDNRQLSLPTPRACSLVGAAGWAIERAPARSPPATAHRPCDRATLAEGGTRSWKNQQRKRLAVGRLFGAGERFVASPFVSSRPA
jgi:hypothetical protein